MRKKIISPFPEKYMLAGQGWFDLERLAQVEITSEDPDHPIEEALLARAERGWRATHPGEQTIRLLFDEPQRIRHIYLEFEEKERVRTQEFVLRWSADEGRTYRDLVRQQYNFGPPGTTLEVEDYRVELDRVTAFELLIQPDIGGGNALASLKHLLVA